MVLVSDKGKRFVLVSEEIYKAMAEDHTAGDIKVSKEEVRNNQRILLAAAMSMANILDLGSSNSGKNLV